MLANKSFDECLQIFESFIKEAAASNILNKLVTLRNNISKTKFKPSSYGDPKKGLIKSIDHHIDMISHFKKPGTSGMLTKKEHLQSAKNAYNELLTRFKAYRQLP